MQLAFLAVMGTNPVAMNFGGTRSAMALTLLSTMALFAPAPAAADLTDQRPIDARAVATVG